MLSIDCSMCTIAWSKLHRPYLSTIEVLQEIYSNIYLSIYSVLVWVRCVERNRKAEELKLTGVDTHVFKGHNAM